MLLCRARVWVEDLAGFWGLVEIGVIEIHPWGAKADDIDHPDTLVFDLDPGEGIGWDFVVERAAAPRTLSVGRTGLLAEDDRRQGLACHGADRAGDGLGPRLTTTHARLQSDYRRPHRITISRRRPWIHDRAGFLSMICGMAAARQQLVDIRRERDWGFR
jgi:LigD-like primase-polymerase